MQCENGSKQRVEKTQKQMRRAKTQDTRSRSKQASTGSSDKTEDKPILPESIGTKRTSSKVAPNETRESSGEPEMKRTKEINENNTKIKQSKIHQKQESNKNQIRFLPKLYIRKPGNLQIKVRSAVAPTGPRREASYLKIARWRSALRVLNGGLKVLAAEK